MNWRTVLSWEDEETVRRLNEEERNRVLQQGIHTRPNQDFSIVVSIPMTGRIEEKAVYPDGSVDLHIDWYPDTETWEAQRMFDTLILTTIKEALGLEGDDWKFAGSWTGKIGLPQDLKHLGNVVNNYL